MKFGSAPIDEADGAILAHAVRIDGLTLKKGDVVTPDRRKTLAEAGVRNVLAARLEDGDVGEDEAAARVAGRLAGLHVRCAAPFTGRVNLFAEAAGLAVIDRNAIDRVNAIDETITVATLTAYRAVEDGDMVATVKIIPFSTREATLEAALEALGSSPAVSVAPFRPLRVAVVSTLLPGLKDSVIAKTLRALEARLAPTGSRVVDHVTSPHDVGALCEALAAARTAGRRARRLRRFRDHRPARRHPGRDRGLRRPDRTVRHAGRSRQSASARRPRSQADHRRARLRAIAEGKRLRLGPSARARRRPDHRRRHSRHGRRRAVDGDCLPAAAARAA